jgi:hypothetical protein
MQRLRPTLIALAVLVLSATAALAATPSRPAFAPGSHHPEASESAGPSKAPDGTEATETAEATEATETAEATKAAELGVGAEASQPVNHGCVVSLAAKTATPSGFKNHGQWVSSVAKDNHGHDQGGDTGTCALPTPAKP